MTRLLDFVDSVKFKWNNQNKMTIVGLNSPKKTI